MRAFEEQDLIEKSDIKNFLIHVLKDNDLSSDDIADDTVLVGDQGLFFDSVDVLELIVELENKYGIKVQDNDIIREKFKDFNSLYHFIKDNAK